MSLSAKAHKGWYLTHQLSPTTTTTAKKSTANRLPGRKLQDGRESTN